MGGLHPETLQLVSLIVTLVSAGVSAVTWYSHRGGPGLRGWAMALLLGAAGALLHAIRGPDSSFRVIVLGDALLVAGFATMWMSMRRFNDPRLAIEVVAIAIGAATSLFVALFTLAWQAGTAAPLHSIVLSLFIFILAMLAAWETWRGRQLDRLQSRIVAAVGLIGIAVARLIRGAMASLAGLEVVDAETRLAAAGYSIYATSVFILIVTFGLVLMASERFERQSALLTEGQQGPPGA